MEIAFKFRQKFTWNLTFKIKQKNPSNHLDSKLQKSLSIPTENNKNTLLATQMTFL